MYNVTKYVSESSEKNKFNETFCGLFSFYVQSETFFLAFRTIVIYFSDSEVVFELFLLVCLFAHSRRKQLLLSPATFNVTSWNFDLKQLDRRLEEKTFYLEDPYQPRSNKSNFFKEKKEEVRVT